MQELVRAYVCLWRSNRNRENYMRKIVLKAKLSKLLLQTKKCGLRKLVNLVVVSCKIRKQTFSQLLDIFVNASEIYSCVAKNFIQKLAPHYSPSHNKIVFGKS